MCPSFPSPNLPTVVLGAGISGLAAADALVRAGRNVLVLDRSSTPGGRIRTEHRSGFLVEHGPNSMVSPAPAAESLIGSLGLSDESIDKGAEVRHRYLVRDGRAHALPLDPLGFFSSGFFSVRGRLRLLAEPFISPRTGDESVADFVRRRFGPELLDYVFDPLVGGLYAGDPRRLSATALFPRLKQLEARHGSIIRGALAKWLAGLDARFDPRRRQLFSFRDGMAALPLRLAAGLGARLRSGVRVEAANPSAGGGFRLTLRSAAGVSQLHAAGLVVALPAYAAARVLEPLSIAAAQALSTVGHPPLAVVALGYQRRRVAHPLDGLGLLTPTIERRSVLGLLFSSTLFAGRAPDDHVLLTAYVGGARQPALAQLPRKDLLALVRKEADALLGASSEPVFESVHYWRFGLPQPDMEHARRIEALQNLEREWPGLVVTGNYTAGVSTVACIEAAGSAALRLVPPSEAAAPSQHLRSARFRRR